ncbi:hypothetical protein J4558_16285 [Leptolyngbya sp. 15MV]|nr:hypothetical protein J4558_16285 [Leptolyngbya sp. 15MV]
MRNVPTLWVISTRPPIAVMNCESSSCCVPSLRITSIEYRTGMSSAGRPLNCSTSICRVDASVRYAG